MKEIETIVGKGERVDWSDVFDAVAATPDTAGEPYKDINGGLWVKWKGKSHTLFIQFPGIMNADDTWSLAPTSEGCLTLFVTEKNRPAKGGKDRSLVLDWKWGAYGGTVRRTLFSIPTGGSGVFETSLGVKRGDGIPNGRPVRSR
jgi:hypothetical protein